MIHLPSSKSIGARYLVATYFNGTLPADPIFEENDDLMVLQEALLEVYSDEEPIDYGDSPIDVGASGTALRFVTAVCASSEGADYVITGTPRLMERPMTPLLQILREAGAGIQCLGENDRGPYRITGSKITGGTFSIRGDISSQFISALMLVAPYWEKGLKLFFTTPLVSRPYIEMTSRLMQNFSIETKLTDEYVEVSPGSYRHTENFRVEADWSSASFFYEASAISRNDIELADLISPEVSLQGDAACAEIFLNLGVESTFIKDGVRLHSVTTEEDTLEIDFRNCPDLVLPVAVAALCKDRKFRFTGVAHLRLKESDRIASLQEEARKLGFVVEAGVDYLEWKGDKTEMAQDTVIDPHDDHRVAMAFAMAAFRFGEVRISNPKVVEKSFIDFWNRLSEIGLTCEADNDIMTVKK